jgi:PAS domain S-box-containing protein
LDVNEAFERNSGFTRDEIIDHTSTELGLWDNPDERVAVIEQINRNGTLRDREIKFRTKSGETRVKRFAAEQIQVGGKQCLLAVCEDITLQKRMEEALRLSEEKFSKAFRSSPNIIAINTLKEDVILDINESYEKTTGYGRNELLGRTSLDVGLWVDPTERETLLRDAEQQGSVKEQEIHIRAKSGHIVVLQISVELIELCREKCLLIVGQDITGRKRAEAGLQCLSGQLLRLQDEERRKIARDLHDTTGQNLVALATNLGQLEASMPSSARKLHMLASSCRNLADQCVHEIRTLSYVLHPPLLDELGLAPALIGTGIALEQFPEPGTQVLRGSQVTVRFGRPSELEGVSARRGGN